MRTLIIIGILFLANSNSQPDHFVKSKAIYTRVVYSFYHMRDTKKPQQFYKEKMQLICNDKTGLYNSYTKFQQDSVREVQLQQAERSSGNNLIINRGLIVPYNKEQIKTSPDKKERNIFLDFDNNHYTVTEPLEIIKWQIGKETRKIGGYPCQEATCNFKGRKYTAWFTTDIPVSFGPWKLHGLPGLILEASDENGQVKFQCESVSTQSNISEIKFPPPGIKTNMNEYTRMVEAYQNNPSSLSNSNSGARIEKEESNSPTFSKSKSAINNPIELSNK